MLEKITTRRSVRKWTAQPVSEQDQRDLLEAAMNAPSAINEQAWQFVVLTGDTLASVVSVNSNTPEGAPLGILVCLDLRAEKAKGYAVQDCSAATQNILLAAHVKGLGGVWTAVFPENAVKLAQALGLPEGVVPFSIVPVGHPATTPAQPPKSRFDAKKVHQQKW